MSIAFDIRHLAGTHEIELFNRIPYALNHEILDDLEQGRDSSRGPGSQSTAIACSAALRCGARRIRRMPRSSTSSTSTTPSPTRSSARSGARCWTPRGAR